MQNAWVDRGSVEIELSESESSSNEDNLVNDKRRKQIHNYEALFKKLKNNTAARSNCSSIDAARAHKYGHMFNLVPKHGIKNQSTFRKN